MGDSDQASERQKAHVRLFDLSRLFRSWVSEKTRLQESFKNFSSGLFCKGWKA